MIQYIKRTIVAKKIFVLRRRIINAIPQISSVDLSPAIYSFFVLTHFSTLAIIHR